MSLPNVRKFQIPSRSSFSCCANLVCRFSTKIGVGEFLTCLNAFKEKERINQLCTSQIHLDLVGC